MEENSTTTHDKNDNHHSPWVDPKVVIDIGRGAMLLGLAAFLLATLGLIEGKQQTVYIPLILLLSSLNILLAARTIDWLFDKINVQSWAKLYGYQKADEFDKFFSSFRKWDGAYFRIKMFGGSYFVFSLIISFVASVSIYFAIDYAQDLGFLLSVSESFGLQTKIKFLVASTFFAYIPYQMLTIRSTGSLYFFVGAVCIIFFLLIERILTG